MEKGVEPTKETAGSLQQKLTDEGTPKDSKVDPSTIAELNLDKSEIISASTEKIKEQSENAKKYDLGGDEALDF